MLRMPVFGDLVRKSTIARWTRTSRHHVRGRRAAGRGARLRRRRSGNYIYMMATKQIQAEVSTGTSLTVAMQNANVFPSMVAPDVLDREETERWTACSARSPTSTRPKWTMRLERCPRSWSR